MKKKMFFISTIIILLIFFIVLNIIWKKASTIDAIVVKVNDKGLSVMKKDNMFELITLSFTDEGNIGFKQGQEISIVLDKDASIMTSFPEQISGVKKIKILKEKSDTQIPNEVLRYFYNSIDNVKVNVVEMTNTGILLDIIDKNELPYDYSYNYKIYKYIKNKDYTGIGYKIGEDTKNSTSGYTGTGFEYVWEEANRISEDAEQKLMCDSLEISGDNNYKVEKIKIDWTPLYGKLENRTI